MWAWWLLRADNLPAESSHWRARHGRCRCLCSARGLAPQHIRVIAQTGSPRHDLAKLLLRRRRHRCADISLWRKTTPSARKACYKDHVAAAQLVAQAPQQQTNVPAHVCMGVPGSLASPYENVLRTRQLKSAQHLRSESAIVADEYLWKTGLHSRIICDRCQVGNMATQLCGKPLHHGPSKTANMVSQ